MKMRYKHASYNPQHKRLNIQWTQNLIRKI